MSDPNRLCPFCSGYIIYTKVDPETNKHYEECQHCFARGPLANSGIGAFDLWHTRNARRIHTFETKKSAQTYINLQEWTEPVEPMFLYVEDRTVRWCIATQDVRVLRVDGTFARR